MNPLRRASLSVLYCLRPAESTPRPNIQSVKVMLCIGKNQKGPIYYKLLKLAEKLSEYEFRHEAIIFLNDNALFCLNQSRPCPVRLPSAQIDGERSHSEITALLNCSTGYPKWIEQNDQYLWRRIFLLPVRQENAIANDSQYFENISMGQNL